MTDGGGCAFQQKRKTARGDIRAAVDMEKGKTGKTRQKTRCVLLFLILIFSR